MKIEWDGKIGPSFAVGCLGTLVSLGVAGVLWYGQQQSTGETNAKEIRELRSNDAQHVLSISNNDKRLAVIENNIVDIKDTLRRIEARQFGELHRMSKPP